jgi:hypothetical protein
MRTAYATTQHGNIPSQKTIPYIGKHAKDIIAVISGQKANEFVPPRTKTTTTK